MAVLVVYVFAIVGAVVVSVSIVALAGLLYDQRLSYKQRYHSEKHKVEELKRRLSQHLAADAKTKSKARKNATPKDSL